MASPWDALRCGDLQKKKHGTNNTTVSGAERACIGTTKAIRHLIEPSKPDEVRVDQNKLPLPGHAPVAAQSSDAPCETSRETSPDTQDADDDLD